MATGGPDRADMSSRVPAKLILSLGGGEPGADLVAQLLHRSGKGVTPLPGLEKLAGDAERGENGGFVGLDHLAAGHYLAKHLVHVIGYCARLLRTGIAANRVLVAEYGDFDDVDGFFDRHRVEVSCSWR